MILYQDALLELDYDVSSDILYVQWPSLVEDDLPELRRAFSELVNALKHYDVKKLLIDSRLSRVAIADEVYKPLLFAFIRELKVTRLSRMARVMPENGLRESKLQSYTEEMRATNMLDFETAEFENKTGALSWLKS